MGYLIIIIAVFIGLIIFLFNRTLKEIVSTSCSHGTGCPMWGSINFQTQISIGVMFFVVLVGLFFIFFHDKGASPRTATHSLSSLDAEEKLMYNTILEAEGTIFQSELVDKLNFQKVKVTRILDKLEGKGLVERKRRGMTNVVVLRH